MGTPDILWLGEPVANARVICVFVHGRGQSPEEMQEGVIRRLATPGVAYALPRAPGGSWYAARAVDALTDTVRDELGQSLVLLSKVIALAMQQNPDAPMLLGGFSQGACLSLEHAFLHGPWNGALVALTGCRVGQMSDVRPAAGLDVLPVYLTGGDADPWISVAAFAEAASCLGRAHVRLRADLFPGRAHEVSDPEIALLDGMLADLAAGKPISWGQAI